MANLHSKALQYAVGGYSIIPLNKKIPRIKEWKEFQTTPADDDQIDSWWKQYPSANIGIVTGKISGITVVDIDTKGETTVPLDAFPETFTVKTPSGGYHLYYEYEKAIKQSANTYPQFPHVDIRNDGGYVVGPGSADGGYEVVNPMEPQAFPLSLFGGVEVETSSSFTEKLKTMKDGEGRNNMLCRILGGMLKNVPLGNYDDVKKEFFAEAKKMDNPLPVGELNVMWTSISGKAAETASHIEFMADGKGFPYRNLENVRKVLTEDDDFLDRCIFDEFKQVFLYRPDSKSAYREIKDTDEITLTREISMKYGFFAMVNPTMVRMAVNETAVERSIDSAKDYVEGLKWDGESRLDQWLHNTYHVKNDAHHTAIGANWMKGLVKRMVEPGCKFDYVLVLEGSQGTYKSSSLGVLGGDWHIETTAAPDSKDFYMLLQGNAIVEFSEGETLSRGEIKQLKAVITTQYDKYRSPYDRHVLTHPRRCVFAMTTNQTEYLKDETGNRRWLPVACQGAADLDWLKANRDQLFAEAYQRVIVDKESTWEFPASVTEAQSLRQVSDPNGDRISQWYHEVLQDHDRQQGVTTHMAYTGALGQIGGRFSKSDEMAIANVFTGVLGLKKTRLRTVSGARSTRYTINGADLPKSFSSDIRMAKELDNRY